MQTFPESNPTLSNRRYSDVCAILQFPGHTAMIPENHAHLVISSHENNDNFALCPSLGYRVIRRDHTSGLWENEPSLVRRTHCLIFIVFCRILRTSGSLAYHTTTELRSLFLKNTADVRGTFIWDLYARVQPRSILLDASACGRPL